MCLSEKREQELLESMEPISSEDSEKLIRNGHKPWCIKTEGKDYIPQRAFLCMDGHGIMYFSNEKAALERGLKMADAGKNRLNVAQILMNKRLKNLKK